MNETKFCASYNRVYQIIIFDLNKLLLLTESNNQKYIISVKNISDGGKTILLILILYKINILDK